MTSKRFPAGCRSFYSSPPGSSQINDTPRRRGLPNLFSNPRRYLVTTSWAQLRKVSENLLERLPFRKHTLKNQPVEDPPKVVLMLVRRFSRLGAVLYLLFHL